MYHVLYSIACYNPATGCYMMINNFTWQFFVNRLKGFDSVRGQILPFSYFQVVAVNTVLNAHATAQPVMFTNWLYTAKLLHRKTPLTLTVVVWRSGSALVSINKVNLHQARLVLEWVTVPRFNSRCGTFMYVTSHVGQLSLSIPSCVGTMRTSQKALMPCGWVVKAGMVRVWVAGKTVWSPCYTQAISERLKIKGLYIRHYINSSVYLFLQLIAEIYFIEQTALTWLSSPNYPVVVIYMKNSSKYFWSYSPKWTFRDNKIAF